MGYNAEGRIIPRNNNDAYIRQLENRIAMLENLQRKKKKQKYNFSRILPAVDPSDYPWV